MNYLEKTFSLKGLRIIVTGASSGLGLSQAIALANCGANVFALSRTGKPKVDTAIAIPDNVHFDAMTCFLASPAATYTTGQDVSEDGGTLAYSHLPSGVQLCPFAISKLFSGLSLRHSGKAFSSV
ncbi:SDR family NAD(P)-dependent oxidoreductase [Sphingobacterium haloxyli]|uniref:SDR family NAD(P)-dependent oxidoreductase n=1 Tax=Sphingobacterium haloxyli TaxID=2100533 RepID=UPI000E42AD1B